MTVKLMSYDGEKLVGEFSSYHLYRCEKRIYIPNLRLAIQFEECGETLDIPVFDYFPLEDKEYVVDRVMSILPELQEFSPRQARDYSLFCKHRQELVEPGEFLSYRFYSICLAHALLEMRLIQGCRVYLDEIREEWLVWEKYPETA
ncbi:MAG: hypothetical protein NC114_11840 [Ruminococcus flavefaciens]|nr:hypothetical protein [Ruminococcus flavefaciens]